MWHPEASLRNREDELAAINSALQRARTGSGSVVVVEGAAGSGKSRLVAAAAERAASAGLRILSARGGQLERDFPFGVVRQLFEPLLATAPAAQRARALAGAAAPAASALGLADGASGVYAAGFAAMNAIHRLTAELASGQALLLVVDDAHWADASSLRALDYLARRLGELSVALILALRPQEPDAPAGLLDELRTTAGAISLTLGPLEADSVAEIVRRQAPGASAEACAACHAVTAGNPFYVHELLRALPDRRAPETSEVYRAAVPSLADRVLRRVARVAPDAPDLIRAMVVLGDGARLATAAALAAVSEPDAVAIAHQLRRIEILAGEDPIAFTHPLLRGSVYDVMSVAELQTAHRGAAALLDAAGATVEEIVAHLRMLEPSGDGALASALAHAAERALERAAPDEAIELLQRALAEGASDPTRGHLLARLGAARMLLRDPAAIGHLREAHGLISEPRARAEVALTLAEVLALTGQWGASMGVIESAEAELGAGDTELHSELAALRVALTLFDPSRIDEFDARRDTYVGLAGGEHWASHAIASLLGIEAAHRGRPQEAVAFTQRALEGGRLLGARGGGAWTAPQVVGAFVEADELERALETIELVQAAGDAAGATFAQFTALSFRGWVNARRGDLAAAEADLHTAFAFAEQTGMMMGITTGVFLFSEVLLERDGQSAFEDLVERVELGPDFLETASGAMLLEVRGRLRVARRDHPGGIADLRTAGRTLTTLRFGPAFSAWRSALALALPAGESTQALALARAELELAEATGLARPIGIALRTVGMLADRLDGIEALRRSVEILQGSPARLEHARSLIELGASLRRANGRAEARPLLVAGRELAHLCGAHRLARQAGSELLAAGSRRTRIATSGRDSLTASELRVISLAAAGATNTEIARELHVTLKTVETHLSHAYGKLGLAGRGSRGRLAPLLATSAN